MVSCCLSLASYSISLIKVTTWNTWRPGAAPDVKKLLEKCGMDITALQEIMHILHNSNIDNLLQVPRQCLRRKIMKLHYLVVGK